MNYVERMVSVMILEGKEREGKKEAPLCLEMEKLSQDEANPKATSVK